MYTKIALILLGITVSMGGALALVIAQNSNVKRPLPPQMAYNPPQTSTIPRIPDTPVASAPVVDIQSTLATLTSIRPVKRPVVVVIAPAPAILTETETAIVEVARAPVAEFPIGTSTSEPNTSPYTALVDSLQPAPVPQTRALSLQEAPEYRAEALTKTWTIGVYR